MTFLKVKGHLFHIILLASHRGDAGQLRDWRQGLRLQVADILI